MRRGCARREAEDARTVTRGGLVVELGLQLHVRVPNGRAAGQGKRSLGGTPRRGAVRTRALFDTVVALVEDEQADVGVPAERLLQGVHQHLRHAADACVVD